MKHSKITRPDNGGTEFFEAGPYRAEVSHKRRFCDNLHWQMQHWGWSEGSTANGIIHRFSSIHAARHAAEQWVSKGL